MSSPENCYQIDSAAISQDTDMDIVYDEDNVLEYNETDNHIVNHVDRSMINGRTAMECNMEINVNDLSLDEFSDVLDILSLTNVSSSNPPTMHALCLYGSPRLVWAPRCTTGYKSS